MYGVECKRADAPAMTPSLKIALKDLDLERVAVIYLGEKRYGLHPQVDVVPFTMIAKGMMRQDQQQNPHLQPDEFQQDAETEKLNDGRFSVGI